MHKPVIFFDIDDTLTTTNSWERLNTHAGMTPETDYALYKKYILGELSYDDWMHELLIYHRSLTKQTALTAFSDYELRTDAKSTIAQLKSHDYEIVLITGSFKPYAENIARDLDISEYYACSDYTYTNDGYVESIVHHGNEDEAKLAFANDYCKKQGIDIASCYCVGDSSNDVLLFKATKQGITFTWCKPEIQAVAKLVVTSLSEIPTKIDIS